MTLRKTYYPQGYPIVNGQITDPALAYVKILEVDRSGVVYAVRDLNNVPTDTGLFCGYTPSTGTIEFLIPFQQDESINIIYAIP